MFIFDVHLDLAMNAMEWNRDLRLPIVEIRKREEGMSDKPDRGMNTVCFPELRKGNIGLVVATMIARYVKTNNPLPGWNSPEQAWAQTQGQLAWYREMERQGELRQIRNKNELEDHLLKWSQNPETEPIGYILSLEGADSILHPNVLDRSVEQGLRMLGPAHYGPGTYAMGTHYPGGLGKDGKALLKKMEQHKLILDVTHLSDESFKEALDIFQGPVWASHSNCRALVPDQRQFTDQQIKILIERGAVIGAPLDAWMMVPGWIKQQSNPQNTEVGLRHMVEHMDHICQLAGNANHIGIGTDLDGGFGKEQGPADLDTIADLQKLPTLLSSRGYNPGEIEGIMSGNFLRFLRMNW